MANYLFPTGPFPPLHCGTHTKGTATGSSSTVNLVPDADDTDGGFTNELGNGTNLYQSIDDTTCKS